MPVYSFEGRTPKIHPEAFVAPSATIVGEVTVEAGASVWYNAVLRADFAAVVVRRGANVQDGSVLHSNPEIATEIGPGATVAHLCVVHSAVVEEEALVANGCTVLDGARVGARSLVAAHSLVAAGTTIPPGVLAAGSPAVVKRPLEGSAAELWVKLNPSGYVELARRHKEGIELVSG